MANRTIYVKDEALWEKAKEVAGADGLSALISKALQDFVERKELEKKGFARQTILVRAGSMFPHDQLVRFDGRLLNSALLGRGLGQPDEIAEAFLTKGGKIVVALSDAASADVFEYHTYSSLEDLGADRNLFSEIPAQRREEFLESLAEALGQKASIWID